MHKGVIDLSPLGEHVGDWEYYAVRIDNVSKELLGIMLSQHGKNVFFDKAAVAESFQMVNATHPVIYSSLNGHANFPSPGPNYTERTLLCLHNLKGELANRQKTTRFSGSRQVWSLTLLTVQLMVETRSIPLPSTKS